MSAIKQALGGLLKPILRAVRVEHVTDVAARFRLIVLAGEALTGPRCAPGDKVQVMIDGDFRTYTPFAFDAAAGRASLLAFLHGDGPGARWGRAVRAGDEVFLFGPRGSLPLRALPSPAVLVGDETSLAVGRSLGELGRPSTVVLEVDDVAATQAAADAIGLRDASFVARAAGDAHVDALWSAVKAASQTSSALVLTGKAQTIQAIRRLAQRDRVAFAAQKNKAYWAPGKRGLD
ncbi:siderophore-interacting protein [Polyangium mundeleinium]|uniref:Siderophore-interacting protein n=1 Tax=Polyangium mundeleinium TaxID=2995306 RepID=A0ABT5EQB9_9BACT|nr:siderophore-interacting protein [Polyangium mundeleinium]MDC0743557.1 siderophore-interacting protein [Polyangium mundeleinium]